MSPRYWRLYWMGEKGTPYLRDYPWRFERKGLRPPRRDPRRPQKPHGISGYEATAARWRWEAKGPLGGNSNDPELFHFRLNAMFKAVYEPAIVDLIPPPSRFMKLMLEDE